MSSSPSDYYTELQSQITRFFAPNSPLASTLSTKNKTNNGESPKELSLAIAHALTHGEQLCVEAPSGNHKMTACLIPAILLAQKQKRPLLISLADTSRQQQLFNQLLPQLQQQMGIPFSAVLAQSRECYLCRRRLEQVQTHEKWHPNHPELSHEIRKIAEWAKTTADTSLATLPFTPSPKTWACVCSENGACIPDACDSHCCAYYQARRRLFQANIILTSHSLLCMDLNRRRDQGMQNSLLPEYTALIIDNVQELEPTAAAHLGLKLSSEGMLFLLHRLYHKKSEQGLLSHPSLLQEARHTQLQLEQAATQFFADLHQQIGPHRHLSVLPRLKTAPSTLHLLQQWQQTRPLLQQAANHPGLTEAQSAEIHGILHQLTDSFTRLTLFLNPCQPHSVCWIETGGAHSSVLLRATPVMPRDILHRELFTPGRPVILLGSPLAIRGHLSYFSNHIGLSDNARKLCLKSPFNYAQQMNLHVPYENEPTTENATAEFTRLCEQLRHFFLELNGTTFVLFPHHADMIKTAREFEPFFNQNRLPFHLQEQEKPHSWEQDFFHAGANPIIFGMTPFWIRQKDTTKYPQNLILLKLPFHLLPPPLSQAREAYIKKAGGDFFRDHLLPEAVLQFRQLVESLTCTPDREINVIVLDPRILHAQYGQLFIESLPQCRRHVF